MRRRLAVLLVSVAMVSGAFGPFSPPEASAQTWEQGGPQAPGFTPADGKTRGRGAFNERLPGTNIPVRAYNVTVRFKTGIGMNVGCVALDDNPLGYYTEYIVTTGKSYEDPAGNRYVDRYSDGQEGPWTMESSRTMIRCGIPD